MIKKLITQWLARKTVREKFDISEHEINSVLAGQVDTQMGKALRATISIMEEDRYIEAMNPKLSDAETKYALGGADVLNDLHHILLEKMAKKDLK